MRVIPDMLSETYLYIALIRTPSFRSIKEAVHGDLEATRSVYEWVVDLCVGSGDEPLGVLCGPHPDGAEAHLERQRALHRAGWRLIDAFASRYADDPRRAALEIAAAQRPVSVPG